MSALLVSSTPDNFRDDFGQLVTEGDTYMICERVRELDRNLIIRRRRKPDDTHEYIVSEMCRDNVERWVFRTEALDARIIEKLEYMLHVPHAKRYEEAERIEAKAEEDRMEAERDKLYDSVGRPMLTDLERCGFIQRPTSYAKRGVTGGRGSRYRQ